MRSSCIYFIFVFCLLSPVFGAQGKVSQLTILLPPDHSVIESQLVGIVIVTDGTLDAVQLKVNNSYYPPVEKINRNVCKVIKLEDGLNIVTIKGFKRNEPVEEQKIALFYRSALSERNGTAPDAFHPYDFHTGERESKCTSCHDFGQRKGNKEPQEASQSPCVRCHKKLLDFKFVHGPASVWECTTCHSSTIKGHKYRVSNPEQTLCYSCHSDAAVTWKAKKFLHGPFSMGTCSVCHNPHASDNDFFLRKQTTDLCLSCHEEQATGTHVVSGISGNGHPIRGKPDPLHPGKELSCASCHDPHASEFSDLLFRDRSVGVEFCKACHKF